MTGGRGVGAVSALQRLAQQATHAAAAAQERCDFCGEGLPDDHRHLLEVATRDMRCVCRACSILFDRREASRGKYQLLPQRRLLLGDFRLDAAQWERLRIPVGMVFFFYNTTAGRMMAYYPSPLGPTESLLELDAWHELVAANPTLETLQPDVEALLINRARGAAQHFLVPLDECYRLVAVIRTQWRGLSGGQEVWRDVERFFDELVKRSKK